MSENELCSLVELLPVCVEHNIQKEWGVTTFEYRDDGIVVRVPNIPAWICPQDGETSFTPETTDKLLATVRELVETTGAQKPGSRLLKSMWLP